MEYSLVHRACNHTNHNNYIRVSRGENKDGPCPYGSGGGAGVRSRSISNTPPDHSESPFPENIMVLTPSIRPADLNVFFLDHRPI